MMQDIRDRKMGAPGPEDVSRHKRTQRSNASASSMISSTVSRVPAQKQKRRAAAGNPLSHWIAPRELPF